jgi:uncharacterized membrane-anchored protein
MARTVKIPVSAFVIAGLVLLAIYFYENQKATIRQNTVGGQI